MTVAAATKTIKSIAGALDVMAQRTPLAVALRQQRVQPVATATTAATTATSSSSNHNNDTATTKETKSFNYQELAQISQALAGFLSAYGYERQDVLVSDLPNTAEHVLLQLACNRLGVHFGTAASLEDMAKFPRIRGAVASSSVDNTTATPGFLTEINLPLPYLDDALLADLLYGNNNNNNHMGISLQADFGMESHDAGDALDGIHAFYGSPDAGMTNQQALELGHQAVQAVQMTADDTVCIAAPLKCEFGMGSAVTASLLAGATVVLPDVTVAKDDKQAAAEAAFETIQECTLLFCDAVTLATLPARPEKVQRLRGGLCKVGSGSTLLYETVGYGGVKLRTMGSLK